MPAISVIMPVYNASEYLAEAIESIISQTFEDWELILIDDGSTDGSASIIDRYAKSDNRLKHYTNERNLGLIPTLNRGISLCKGRYIARMDADDVSLPDRFEEQYKFLEKNKDIAMCGINAILIDSEGKNTGKISGLETDEYLRINLLFTTSFVHPGMMIRADVLKENLYDERYKHAEDYELWCRIARNHKVANIPHFLLRYRWHATNVSVVNRKTQEDIKQKVIREQLLLLGLEPTEEELYLHTISYRQYDIKEKSEKEVFSDYDKLDRWYSKIVEANKQAHRYDFQALSAHLWSRWIVLCVAQKNYRKLLSRPRFVSLNFDVMKRIVRLVYFFSKK